MTEMFYVAHFSPIVNKKIRSFGQPLSRTRVKLQDVNTGVILAEFY